MATRGENLGFDHVPLRVLGIGAGAHPPGTHSSSRMLLEHALEEARQAGAEVRTFDLTALSFRSCPDREKVCAWPCRVTVADPNDGLGPVYDALVDWADVVVVSTAIDPAGLAEPMQLFLQRLRCIRHELEANQHLLVRNKVSAFLLCGPRSAAAAQLLATFADLGFTIPPFPFAGTPPDSCIAPEAEGFDRLLEVHPEAADAAGALALRAMDLATRIAERQRPSAVGEVSRVRSRSAG